MESINNVCKICKKKYSNYSNLKKHVKKFHVDKVGELLLPAADIHYKYRCDVCSKNFNHLRHLNFHTKTHVITSTKSPTATAVGQYVQLASVNAKQCPLCTYKDSFKNNLYGHFQQVHDITIETKSIEFDSLDKYHEWKCKTESETKSKFVKEYGSRTADSKTFTSFICHRSGKFISESKGLRHLKLLGSNKINGFCPAAMTVSVDNKNSKVKVKFIKTHVGHQIEIGHIFLTSSERDTIAAKIAAHIPFSSILDDVRDSVSNSELNRLHLLTKKDLYNIESCYNLKSDAVRHKDDAVSVDVWVQDLQDVGAVLLYKPQGKIMAEYEQLKSEDFVLIIMTDAQKEICLKYCSDCICIAGTHGLNGYGFELMTLSVLDNLRQGFPCGFLVSNRSDKEVLSIFYSCIKENIQTSISPDVFMSDMADSFYSAWIEVMSPPQLRLYCTWQVDGAWRKNLNKISGKDTQVEVYKNLRTLLQETDTNTFSVMMENFLQQLQSNEATHEFFEYFQHYYYAPNTQRWAYCHRTHAGINTNMHIENMHRALKYIYLNGTNVKRLDKAIHAIMKFVRDKFFDMLVAKHKGKVCSKIKELRKRHKSSETMDPSFVFCENAWQIQSSRKSFEVYTVQEISDNCNCQLICSDCGVCMHKYQCSCMDYVIKWNMCKHVHLLCKFLRVNKDTTQLVPQETIRSYSPEQRTLNKENGDGDNSLYIHEETNVQDQEDNIILKELGHSTASSSQDASTTDIIQEKNKLKLFINNIIDSAYSMKEVDVIKRNITELPAKLKAQRAIKSLLVDS